MDETAIAFEPPHVRAAATASGQPLDRISLREHVRALEIGAFHSERGVSQRVRFDVVLEVVAGLAGQSDDVDRVLSYDTIVQAIDAALAAERLNLLETLAERVAAGCLADPRAARAFVRIEKLDRLPGALGVEIVRSRLPQGAVRVRAPEVPTARPRAEVIYLGAAPADDWLAAALARPAAALVVAPDAAQAPAGSEPGLRIGLLAMEQAAWALAARAAAMSVELSVAASRTELDWALVAGRPVVWAPAKMLTDALPRPEIDASRPAALAAWLAAELGAEALVLCAAADPGALAPGLALRRPGAPAELAG